MKRGSSATNNIKALFVQPRHFPDTVKKILLFSYTMWQAPLQTVTQYDHIFSNVLSMSHKLIRDIPTIINKQVSLIADGSERHIKHSAPAKSAWKHSPLPALHKHRGQPTCSTGSGTKPSPATQLTLHLCKLELTSLTKCKYIKEIPKPIKTQVFKDTNSNYKCIIHT